jgi:acylphosphatase
MIVRGDVQGVGFRWATERQARRLGVAGHVRNLPTGDVEVVAEGEAAAVDQLIAWANHGPPAARVTALDVNDEPPIGEADGFDIRQ